MDSATLQDKIEQTVKSGKGKMYFDLLGTESLRCWLNVYMPGEGTAGLHYHHSDETFTVIEGSGEIFHRDGNRTKIDKGSVVLIPAKTYYDIKNTGDSVLALLGNRTEAFGGPTIYLDAELNQKMKGRKHSSGSEKKSNHEGHEGHRGAEDAEIRFFQLFLFRTLCSLRLCGEFSEFLWLWPRRARLFVSFVV